MRTIEEKYLCSEHSICDATACIHKTKHSLKDSCTDEEECTDHSEATCELIPESPKDIEQARAEEDIELVKKFVGYIT